MTYCSQLSWLSKSCRLKRQIRFRFNSLMRNYQRKTNGKTTIPTICLSSPDSNQQLTRLNTLWIRSLFSNSLLIWRTLSNSLSYSTLHNFKTSSKRKRKIICKCSLLGIRVVVKVRCLSPWLRDHKHLHRSLYTNNCPIKRFLKNS